MENLIEYGYTPILDTEGYMPARITAVHRERFEIVCENGFAFARLKSGVYYSDGSSKKSIKEVFPTVGDFVLIQYNDSGDSLIVKTLERKSLFERKDPASKLHKNTDSDIAQAVAANFDYVFICTSLNNDFNVGRIERYLTIAWQSEAIPVIILTKADLKEDYSKEENAVRKIAGNAMVHIISSKTGMGIDELRDYFRPRKTIVFLGSSGVGKSSLLNKIAGKEIMKVNGIREDDSKGRHTTTHRQLIRLDNGAMIIDTPGMRELGMWYVEDGLSETFYDVERYLGKCRFSNCTHTVEPGCAILEAIENGQLDEDRWNSYRKISGDSVNMSMRDRMLRDKILGKDLKKYNKRK